MKAYISKYALSADVYEIECRQDPAFKGCVVQYKTGQIFELGKEAHFTREAAIADAERRRNKEIARLEKLIVKYKALKFK